jgi:hypothetical protein
MGDGVANAKEDFVSIKESLISTSFLLLFTIYSRYLFP